MLKVALYSHDTFGLGHLRRSLRLAAHLDAQLGPMDALLLTGSPWHSLFASPPGLRVVPLEPVVKEASGRYASRHSGKPLAQVLRRRRETLTCQLEAFRPDLFVVDNVPCGLHGEILPALRALRRRRARVVLSLRDILDDLDRARQEWTDLGADRAARDYFDEVWVFGNLEDTETLIERGPLSAVAQRVHTCGRIQHPPEIGTRPATLPSETNQRKRVLVTGGGGRDAAPLINTYLEALEVHQPDVRSQVVLGPDFPTESLADLPTDTAATTVTQFVPDLPRQIAKSRVVVAMAGYNTVCEILAAGRRAVLVPRVSPRREQLIRARRCERDGRASVLEPAELNPNALWCAVEEALGRPSPPPLVGDGGPTAASRAARLLGVAVRGVA